jgi:hypothetical protein
MVPIITNALPTRDGERDLRQSLQLKSGEGGEEEGAEVRIEGEGYSFSSFSNNL